MRVLPPRRRLEKAAALLLAERARGRERRNRTSGAHHHHPGFRDRLTTIRQRSRKSGRQESNLRRPGSGPGGQPLTHTQLLGDRRGLNPLPPRSQRGVHASTPRPPYESFAPRAGVEPTSPASKAGSRPSIGEWSELRESNPRRRFVGPRPCHWTKLRELLRCGLPGNRTPSDRVRAGYAAFNTCNPSCVPPAGVEPAQCGLKGRCPDRSGVGGLCTAQESNLASQRRGVYSAPCVPALGANQPARSLVVERAGRCPPHHRSSVTFQYGRHSSGT